MEPKAMFKSAILDSCVGFLAFVLFVAGTLLAISVVPFLNAGPGSIYAVFGTAVIAFFCAGWFREAANAGRWWNGLPIGLAGALLGLAIVPKSWSSGHKPALMASLLLFVVGSTTGAWARQFWKIRSAGKVAAFLLIPVLSFFVLVRLVEKKSTYQYVNQPVPPFSITTIDGSTMQSTELKGHVVVLSFWATSCVPCWGELQKVERVHQHFSTNPDVAIFAVAAPEDQPEAIRAFANYNKLSLSMARDTANAASRLGVEGLPRLFVIDKAGNIRMDFGGGDTPDDLQAKLIREIADLAKTH